MAVPADAVVPQTSLAQIPTARFCTSFQFEFGPGKLHRRMLEVPGIKETLSKTAHPKSRQARKPPYLKYCELEFAVSVVFLSASMNPVSTSSDSSIAPCTVHNDAKLLNVKIFERFRTAFDGLPVLLKFWLLVPDCVYSDLIVYDLVSLGQEINKKLGICARFKVSNWIFQVFPSWVLENHWSSVTSFSYMVFPTGIMATKSIPYCWNPLSATAWLGGASPRKVWAARLQVCRILANYEHVKVWSIWVQCKFVLPQCIVTGNRTSSYLRRYLPRYLFECSLSVLESFVVKSSNKKSSDPQAKMRNRHSSSCTDSLPVKRFHATGWKARGN